MYVVQAEGKIGTYGVFGKKIGKAELLMA